MVQKVRSRFGRGLRVAYYRDVVRPQILKTAPVTELTDSRCEIHVLTSKADWLNLVWSLKSFYRASGRRYRLCIHDDGSLDAQAKAELAGQFPEARLMDRAASDREVLPSLAAYPRCQAFRQSNHLAPKLFDFRHYLRGDRMLLFDSDLLFFEEPVELLRRIETPGYRLNSVNADVASAYTVSPAEVRERFGFDLVDRFNSGLGLIHRDSLRLEWMEEFLAMPEQTLLALCSCRHGVELLPDEYRVSLQKGTEGCVEKHYVGAVRHLMYSEGMAKLVRQGILRKSSVERPAIARFVS
jgi:hypothetical protein